MTTVKVRTRTRVRKKKPEETPKAAPPRTRKKRSKAEPVHAETRSRRSQETGRRPWLLRVLAWLPDFLVKGLIRGALRLLAWVRNLFQGVSEEPRTRRHPRVLRVAVA